MSAKGRMRQDSRMVPRQCNAYFLQMTPCLVEASKLFALCVDLNAFFFLVDLVVRYLPLTAIVKWKLK